MAIEYLHHINLSDNQIKNVLLDNKTTTQRNAMTAAAGHVIFNTSLSKFQFYDGSNWLNLQDELVASEVRAMISATDAGGDGSFTYDPDTGAFTYTGPSAAEVRAHISESTGISITDGAISTTITQYTDALVQAYISAGTGVTISSSGQISIGQNVAEEANVTFNDIQIDGDADIDGSLTVNGDVTLGNATSDTVTIKGNLNVEGSTVSVNQTEINVTNAFVFEGATADAHETTLTIAEPTADRTITLPNVSGTIAMTSQLTSDDGVRDIVGSMVSGNTETGLSVTYNSDKNLDFVLTKDPTITLTGDVTGSGTMTNLGNVSIALDTVKNKAANGTGPVTDADTEFTFTHGLGTNNVIVQTYKSNSVVHCELEIIDTNNVKITFASGQAADSITVNVLSAAS
jgi:hypothetical protein|tara:strand:- start:1901 stop:3106 length:1206 start_codon:yes stop_codon:yes gene_type:complete